MGERRFALFGLVGPLVAFLFIALSIGLSPWFNWQDNALSDLGHATDSSVAPLFNFGLFFAGFLVMVYSVMVLRTHARYTGFCLLVSSLLLQLVAVFDEVYGSLHFLVSVLLFVSFGFASLAYGFEKRSALALAAFAIGFCSWAFYLAGVYGEGVAVPETISSVAVVSWVASSALKALRLERK
jgi:hypothetical membrane protein